MDRAKRIIVVLVILALGACQWHPVRLPIASIRNESEISGSFFLGCGTIEGEEYIYSWAQTPQGWMLAKVKRTRAFIVMDTATEPYLIFETNAVGDYSYRSGIPTEYAYTYFHVPPGTIVSNYVLR